MSIEKRQAEIDALHRDTFGEGAARAPGASNGHPPAGVVDLDDRTLLDRALAAANGSKIRALWTGDTTGYSSPSEADAALALHLAFWCGRDIARMDRLFRGSGLMRDKWDEKRGGETYGTQTLRHAAALCQAVYTPGGERPVSTQVVAPAAGATDPPSYIESIADFLTQEDQPETVIFPEILPAGVIMLLHGDPRARKSLTAFEMALSAATGTCPFGLARFRPATAINVLYIQEEDPRSLTRPRRRRLVRERCGDDLPATLHVSIRRGVDPDDLVWVERLIDDLKRLDVRLLVLDAARRLSSKTDEGPAKVRELTAILRRIVTAAGITLVIVHHDVKPLRTGEDQRSRSQRASGGDWFATSECPVHVERLPGGESLVFPQDYKFSADPAPFTFTCVLDGRLISGLVGTDTTSDRAESAGVRGKAFKWLAANGPASKTAMKKAGLGRWETIGAAIEGGLREGKVDSIPGRTAGTHLYFVVSATVPQDGDGSASGRVS